MRPWMIVLFSLVAAALAAAGPAVPFVSLVPQLAIAPGVLPHTPALAAAALAAYALAALLLTTATLILDMMGLRRRLLALATLPSPSGRDLGAAFAASRLRHVPAACAPAGIPTKAAGRTIPIYDTLKPDEARGEVARLHYLWLARTHFFTAIALLAAVAALGLAQQYRPVVALPGSIPTVRALIAFGGLLLLGGWSRLAVDVAGEAVVDAIRRLPCEPIEVALLRRLTELLATARAAAPGSEDLAKRLAAAVRESRRVWLDAATDLSAAAEALGATIRSSVEVLDAALRAASERVATPVEDTVGAPAMAELQVGVDRLTAAIDRLGTAAQATEGAGGDEAMTRPANADGRLAAELAQLLREIDAET